MAAQQGQLVARALPRLLAPWTRHESPLPVANEVFGLRAHTCRASAPPQEHYSLLLSIWRFGFSLSKGARLPERRQNPRMHAWGAFRASLAESGTSKKGV